MSGWKRNVMKPCLPSIMSELTAVIDSEAELVRHDSYHVVNIHDMA
jgi:hypothetical protein